jgi:hypothetical protein
VGGIIVLNWLLSTVQLVRLDQRRYRVESNVRFILIRQACGIPISDIRYIGRENANIFCRILGFTVLPNSFSLVMPDDRKLTYQALSYCCSGRTTATNSKRLALDNFSILLVGVFSETN